MRQHLKRSGIPESDWHHLFVRIELYGEMCVKTDYRGHRMLVPILHSLCVDLVIENSGEIKKQVSHNSATEEETLTMVWSTTSIGGIILWMVVLQ